MTAEQLRLVRDLRSFESPACMEAAAAIEKQAAQIAQQAEAISTLQATANRLLAENVKLQDEIAGNEKSLQYYTERDHGGSLR